MKIRKYIFMLLACAATMSVSAQNDDTEAIRQMEKKGWTIGLRAGYNIGGTMPIPIPAEMTSINSFNPGLNFGVQVDFDKTYNKHWGLGLGLRFETKGMDTDVTVENYHTVFKQGTDQTECNYTGKQSTSYSGSYLTIPVLGRYRFNSRWSVVAGPYFGIALHKEFKGDASEGYQRQLKQDPITGAMVPTGLKTDVTPQNPASYDFSDDMRTFNYGIEVGFDWQAFKHFLVFAHLDWGLNDAFKDSFNETIPFPMYPVYGQIGFGYKF